MTFQDPDDRRRSDDYIDGAGEGVGWAPLVLGIAALGLIAFLFLGSPRQSDGPALSQRSELPNTAPGAPSIPPPTPPTPQ
jgi:hypothetical protein